MSKARNQDYDLYAELASLSRLLGDYHGWFAGVTEKAFYGSAGHTQDSAIPSLFIESLSVLPKEEFTEQTRESLKLLDEQHHKLEEHALALGRSGEKPQLEKFQEFSRSFQMFMVGLQKNCQSLILEEWGLDVLTGLKNKRALEPEMRQEMERLSRHGQAFSLALVKIDDFEAMQQALGGEGTQMMIKRVAGLVRASLRSFDGAYNLGHGEFVLSLKQAGLKGGQKALERLRDQLEKAGITYALAGASHKLTMSGCVAEPLPEDDLQVLLNNLRVDLDSQEKEAGTVLTYFEMSPLQQYVRSGQKD